MVAELAPFPFPRRFTSLSCVSVTAHSSAEREEARARHSWDPVFFPLHSHLPLPSVIPSLGLLCILYFLLSFDGREQSGTSLWESAPAHMHDPSVSASLSTPSVPAADPVTGPVVSPRIPRRQPNYIKTRRFADPLTWSSFCLLRSCTPHSPTALLIVRQSIQQPSTPKVNVIHSLSSGPTSRSVLPDSLVRAPRRSPRRFASGAAGDVPSPDELVCLLPRRQFGSVSAPECDHRIICINEANPRRRRCRW